MYMTIPTYSMDKRMKASTPVKFIHLRASNI